MLVASPDDDDHDDEDVAVAVALFLEQRAAAAAAAAVRIRLAFPPHCTPGPSRSFPRCTYPRSPPPPAFALSAALPLALSRVTAFSRAPSRCQAAKRGANDSPSATGAATATASPERSGEPVGGLGLAGTADPDLPLYEVAGAAAAAASAAGSAAAAAAGGGASTAAAGSATPAAVAPASTAGVVDEGVAGKGPPAAGGMTSRREAFAKVSRYRVWRQGSQVFRLERGCCRTLKGLCLECRREAGGAGNEWLRPWLSSELPRSEGGA